MDATTHSAKSKTAAYLLWFFFGSVGAHKFYLRRPLVGALYLAGWASVWAGLLMRAPIAVTAIVATALAIAIVIDLFTIPAQVRAANGATAGAPTTPGARRPMFAPTEDAPFDGAAADAAIARYKAQQTAAPQLARAGATRPSFGRR